MSKLKFTIKTCADETGKRYYNLSAKDGHKNLGWLADTKGGMTLEALVKYAHYRAGLENEINITFKFPMPSVLGSIETGRRNSANPNFANLPTKVDLLLGLPEVYDQGELGSASACANALAIEAAQQLDKGPEVKYCNTIRATQLVNDKETQP